MRLQPLRNAVSAPRRGQPVKRGGRSVALAFADQALGGNPTPGPCNNVTNASPWAIGRSDP